MGYCLLKNGEYKLKRVNQCSTWIAAAVFLTLTSVWGRGAADNITMWPGDTYNGSCGRNECLYTVMSMGSNCSVTTKSEGPTLFSVSAFDPCRGGATFTMTNTDNSIILLMLLDSSWLDSSRAYTIGKDDLKKGYVLNSYQALGKVTMGAESNLTWTSSDKPYGIDMNYNSHVCVVAPAEVSQPLSFPDTNYPAKSLSLSGTYADNQIKGITASINNEHLTLVVSGKKNFAIGSAFYDKKGCEQVVQISESPEFIANLPLTDVTWPYVGMLMWPVNNEPLLLWVIVEEPNKPEIISGVLKTENGISTLEIIGTGLNSATYPLSKITLSSVIDDGLKVDIRTGIEPNEDSSGVLVRMPSWAHGEFTVTVTTGAGESEPSKSFTLPGSACVEEKTPQITSSTVVETSQTTSGAAVETPQTTSSAAEETPQATSNSDQNTSKSSSSSNAGWIFGGVMAGFVVSVLGLFAAGVF